MSCNHKVDPINFQHDANFLNEPCKFFMEQGKYALVREREFSRTDVREGGSALKINMIKYEHHFLINISFSEALIVLKSTSYLEEGSVNFINFVIY